MYRVVGMDGQVYGPVDLETMQRWCAEGRVAPSSTVIDERTGRQGYAQSMPDLAGCFALQPTNYTAPPAPYMGNAGYPTPSQGNPGYAVGQSPKNKVVAMLLAFFLGVFGAHRFYLGHISTGIAMLVMTCVSCLCVPIAAVTAIWAFVDLILIATDSLVDVAGQRLS